jgi:hypothetical protein
LPSSTSQTRRLKSFPLAGERLSSDDDVFLDGRAGLFAPGALPNLVRQRKDGPFACYKLRGVLRPEGGAVRA